MNKLFMTEQELKELELEKSEDNLTRIEQAKQDVDDLTEQIRIMKHERSKIEEQLQNVNNKLIRANRKIYYINSTLDRIPNPDPNIESIVFGKMYRESNPSQHTCKIHYFDGTVVEYGNEYNNWINAKYVADNYFDNLDEEDKLYFCQYLPINMKAPSVIKKRK